MLKKVSPLLFLIAGIFALSGCKSNKKDDSTTDTITGNTSVLVKEAEKTTNTISGANYTLTPDTALLGKSFEAKVKINGASLIPLEDPDGKAAGSEFTVNLSITNKSTLDAKKFFTVSSSDARLEMDNGQAVPPSSSSGNSGPEAESTSSAEWKFRLPKDTKPAKLHLYLDGTRVTLALNPQ